MIRQRAVSAASGSTPGVQAIVDMPCMHGDLDSAASDPVVVFTAHQLPRPQGDAQPEHHECSPVGHGTACRTKGHMRVIRTPGQESLSAIQHGPPAHPLVS